MMFTSYSPMKGMHSSWNNGVYTNIFTPRPYQIELLECAVRRNTIVCVNTEAGKRFISTMLIRELVTRCNSEDAELASNKLAVLLLNSENSVDEQSEVLQNHLDLCVCGLKFGTTTDDWKSVFENNQVVLTTPSLLLECFEAMEQLAKRIDVLVFDECQWVCDELHPYHKIMKILDEASLSPSILGLTCSLLKDDASANDLKLQLEKMEFLLHSTAETATDLIALDRQTLSRPVENIILSTDQHLDEEPSYDLTRNLRSLLRDGLDWINSCQVTSNTKLLATHWQIPGLKVTHDADSSPVSKAESGSDNVSEANGDAEVEIDSAQAPPPSQEEQSADVDDSTDSICPTRTPQMLLEEVLLVLDVLGPWCVHRLLSLILKQLQKALLVFERQTKATGSEVDDDVMSGALIWKKTFLHYVNTKLRLAYAMCHKHFGGQKTVNLMMVSPKVHRLLQVLKEYKPAAEKESNKSAKYNDRKEANYVSWWQDSDAEDEEDAIEENSKKDWSQSESHSSSFTNVLCGIVFVQERYVAMMLHRLLREICKQDKELKHVCCSYLIYSGSDNDDIEFDTASMDKTKQEEVVRKFRSHETNLLVCTGGLEDCAFIPKCNLVVRFDVPRSYRAYALSKSRARAQTSAHVMLVRETEKLEFMEKLQEYKRIERVLQGPSWPDEEALFPDDDGEGDTDDYDDVIRPYRPNVNVSATMRNAIKIVNRYCSRLPSDPFTNLSPRCEVVHSPSYDGFENVYWCTLQLPINSHVREKITGPSMSSVILAQRAVAVEAVKRLHEAGELDDHLMPIGKETVKYDEELDPWKPEKSSVSGRPGSTKRRQTYGKETPATLSNCLPTSEINVFIYEIKMNIHVPLPDELNVRRRKLFFPEDTPRCFGILTTKPIPEIPGFPIFTRSGEEFARLRLCRAFVSLTSLQIKLIRNFHRYVFSDMLRLDRVPLSFQPNNAATQPLVVVLNKVPGFRCEMNASGLDIDWSFMMRTEARRMTESKMKKDPWYCHRVSERRRKFTFNRKLYEDGVVIAKYRSCDQPNRFYVAEIKDDLSPASSFPSSEYQSFLHYYKHKYALDVKCAAQPLLDVDHTSSRLNLLTPRHLNQKGKALPLSSLEKKRAKYESLHNRQILVPELCEVHPIPASLWRKAVCLPSVLYRLSQLLIAEELRVDIALRSGITAEYAPVAHRWPDLDFGWSTSGAPSSPTQSTEHHSVKSLDESAEENLNLSTDDCTRDRVVEGSPRAVGGDFPSSPSEEQVTENSENVVNSPPVSETNVNVEAEMSQETPVNGTGDAHARSKATSLCDLSPESDESMVTEQLSSDIGHDFTANAALDRNHDVTVEIVPDTSHDVTAETVPVRNHDVTIETVPDINHDVTIETIPDISHDVSIETGHDPNHRSVSHMDSGGQSSVTVNNTHGDSGIVTERDDDVICNDADSTASFSSDDYNSYFTLSESDSENRKLPATKRVKRKRKSSRDLSASGNNLIRFVSREDFDEIRSQFSQAPEVVGPGPGLLLQALTLSNASDGFNLERLEMLGDSFLKHAVTVYLYCTYPDAHEGKLSYMRSKKVSNYNLYRIGRQFGMAGKMNALIFDPTVNWMPTGFVTGTGDHDSDSDDNILSDDELEIDVWEGATGTSKSTSSSKNPQQGTCESLTDATTVAQPASTSTPTEVAPPRRQSSEEELYDDAVIDMIDGMVLRYMQDASEHISFGGTGLNGKTGVDLRRMPSNSMPMRFTDREAELRINAEPVDDFVIDTWTPVDMKGKPVNSSDPLMLDLHTQHSLADKSIADGVEALLGSYLTSCGQRAAQLLLCHLGLRVLPPKNANESHEIKTVDRFGSLEAPHSEPLDAQGSDKLRQLLHHLSGFEQRTSYTFRNKSYLLQAFTHASYYYNTVTDCYQRLEFLGDAVLDFLITRHLFNDERHHSPGALTDLRSALVNNTIFASLAVRYNYHKYFKAISPELQRIIEEFVTYQQKQEDAQGMDAQLMKHYGENNNNEATVERTAPSFFDCDEEEDGETEDVEVPKALGDIFESVAGAIYMDSGMDLSAVWKVYSPMMLPLIEKFSSCVPRSPVRELLEMEPETAKFSCAEKRYDGKVRVTVEIIGKGRFKGVGRSYRIAKSAAARRALRYLKYHYY